MTDTPIVDQLKQVVQNLKTPNSYLEFINTDFQTVVSEVNGILSQINAWKAAFAQTGILTGQSNSVTAQWVSQQITAANNTLKSLLPAMVASEIGDIEAWVTTQITAASTVINNSIASIMTNFSNGSKLLDFNFTTPTGQPTYLFGTNDQLTISPYTTTTLNVNLATYLSSTTQQNTINGKNTVLSMDSNAANLGSFTCSATGTGDTSLAGLSFLNSNYAIKLGVRSDGFFGIGGLSRSTWSWYSDANGNMVAAGDVAAYSDPRLKENFTIVTDPFAIIDRIDGGTFTWKKGIPHTACKAGRRDYGILADQVEAVMPEIVSHSIEIDDQTYRVVAYEKIVPVMLEALKQLRKENQELKGRLDQIGGA